MEKISYNVIEEFDTNKDLSFEEMKEIFNKKLLNVIFIMEEDLNEDE